MNSHPSRISSMPHLILMDVIFFILSRPGSAYGHASEGSSAPDSGFVGDYGPVNPVMIMIYLGCKYQGRWIELLVKTTMISGSYYTTYLILLVAGSSAPSISSLSNCMINLNLSMDDLAGSPAVGPAIIYIIYMCYPVDLHVIVTFGSSALSLCCCLTNYSTYDVTVDFDTMYEFACFTTSLMYILDILTVINFGYSGGRPVVGPPFSKFLLSGQNLHVGPCVDFYLCSVCFSCSYKFTSGSLLSCLPGVRYQSFLATIWESYS